MAVPVLLIEIELWQVIVWPIIALIAGFIAGFFTARYVIKKQLEKNPPISEKAIRAMFMQMGRKPSEAQIRSVMNSMKNSNK